MASSLATAALASVFLESMLYGIFVALFCMYVFLVVRDTLATRSKRRATYTSMPFIGSILLFCTVTPHWIVATWRSLQAFVFFSQGAVPELYLANVANPWSLLECILAGATIMVGDCLLIYRLWVIWNHNWLVVMLPALSVLAGLASFVGFTYVQSRYQYGSLSRLDEWELSGYGSTLGTNLYSCSLICWRLWRRFRVPTVDSFGQRDLATRTLAIFTESAALYVAWVFIGVVVSITSSSVFYLISQALVPLTGIVFMLINVRVKLGYAIGLEPTHDAPEHTSQSDSRLPIAAGIGSIVTMGAESTLDEHEIVYFEAI